MPLQRASFDPSSYSSPGCYAHLLHHGGWCSLSPVCCCECENTHYGTHMPSPARRAYMHINHHRRPRFHLQSQPRMAHGNGALSRLQTTRCTQCTLGRRHTHSNQQHRCYSRLLTMTQQGQRVPQDMRGSKPRSNPIVSLLELRFNHMNCVQIMMVDWIS